MERFYKIMKSPTIATLEKMNACKTGIDWFIQNKKSTIEKTIENADKEGLECANWYIVRKLTDISKVKYAIYAAEKVLHIFEEKYPDDKRPADAIKAARKYVENPTKENKNSAYSAAYAAYAAAATYAADAAAAAAYSSAYSAYAAADAAADAAANAAVGANHIETIKSIIHYGIKIIQEVV